MGDELATRRELIAIAHFRRLRAEVRWQRAAVATSAAEQAVDHARVQRTLIDVQQEEAHAASRADVLAGRYPSLALSAFIDDEVRQKQVADSAVANAVQNLHACMDLSRQEARAVAAQEEREAFHRRALIACIEFQRDIEEEG